MKAELISIGDEILIGQIVNTNSVFLAKELNKIGVAIAQITAISDEKNTIINALDQARERADIIIMTGGLGPTKDDLTKHTLCEYFDDHLVKDEAVLAHIENIFKKYVTTPISDMNRAQANLPSKATLLHNRFGTAAGMWFLDQDQIFISLPGVPYEMEALIKNEVLPKIQEQFVLPSIYHKTILTYGLGESVIAERIEKWEENLPKEIKLAYLPSLGRVRLRLTTTGKDMVTIKNAVDAQVAEVIPLIKDIYYGTEEDKPIEVLIGEKLKQKGKTLSCAESCTGGAIAARLTANAGASKFFNGSAITYAVSSKTQILGVSKSLIDQNGEVSAAVVESMALGAQKKYGTDYALATTGNAGPSKSDQGREVGTVFIGIATPEKVESFQFNMGNNRTRVIHKTVNQAFEILFSALLKS
ncbi:MAG: competence/damage-inducible protein A [Flavobacteriales bacterium MED-G15]|nr:MAG: competence/damage-inducible protein A [Flavobacteriales bacterium MED-G15]|tara:strand:- start:16389 stop:17636 length:1248 start_codon:yes stop_codon:yes gene_type:complete